MQTGYCGGDEFAALLLLFGEGDTFRGADHVVVAATLNNLGNAYGSLGDHAKKRDLLERAFFDFSSSSLIFLPPVL